MKSFVRTITVIIICMAAIMLAAACQNEGIGAESSDYMPSLSGTSQDQNGEVLKLNGQIKYSPKNYLMWDNWYVEMNGMVHLIHLKWLKSGVNYDMEAENKRGFGHAVSTDLVHWEERSDILKVSDSDNELDVDYRYTGSAIVHNGRCYIFYTMRKWGGQRIGVAWSDDMENWTEYAGNPILEPDSEYFITFDKNNPGTSNNKLWGDSIDCRDFLVIKDPDGEGFYGYFVASAEGEFTTPTAVVGLAYSTDLLNWEQLGIVYRPDGVSMPEMIDVFEVDGKWYMTLTTGKNNGGINMFSDPYVVRAQIYAVSDSPKGPFIEDKEDNVVFGGGTYGSGYSSRSIMFDGIRRMLYTDNNGGDAVLSFPKNVGLNDKGQLRAYYASDLMESIRTGELTTEITAQPSTSFAWPTHGGHWLKKEDQAYICNADRNSWQACFFDSISKNMELCFTVDASSDCSSFGIVLSNASDLSKPESIQNIIVLDRENDRVYMTDYMWEFKNARYFDFDDNLEYEIRMILAGNTVEVYINDEFVFNSAISNLGRNHTGLFVNDRKHQNQPTEII